MVTKTLRTKRTKTSKTSPAEALADLSLRDDVLLTTAAAAALLGLSPKSLRQMRSDRNGPAHLKLGVTQQARTLYRRSDLEAWVRTRVAVVKGS